jgi:hypothetical protein
MNGGPLCTLYPVLFWITPEKDITVKDFYSKNGELRFRRWLPTTAYPMGGSMWSHLEHISK